MSSLTPEKVIQDMSFADSSSYEPRAPPPVDAPPPVPPSQQQEDEITSNNNDNDNNIPTSYQKQNIRYTRSLSSSSARAIPPPTVTNYHDQDSNNNKNQLGVSTASSSYILSRGDASLRPNTGFLNAAEGDPAALQEVLWKMRVCNLAACAVSLLSEIPNFFQHVFFLHPARVVLGVYLTFFCLVLMCYELHTPYIHNLLTDQFGVVHHPVGRALFLWLMSGLSIGQGAVLSMVVGIVFFGTGLLTLYAYIKYPEYRRRVDEQPDLTVMARQQYLERGGGGGLVAWARPDIIASSSTGAPQQPRDSERQSLMGTSMAV